MLLATMWSTSAVPNRGQSHFCTCCKTRPSATTWAWCCSHHHSCSATAGTTEYRLISTLHSFQLRLQWFWTVDIVQWCGTVYTFYDTFVFISWKVSAISSIYLIPLKQLQLHEWKWSVKLNWLKLEVELFVLNSASLSYTASFALTALHWTLINVKPFRFLI